MGWKGESRRHSLSRKGIKTNLPDGRRFDVSNFVARGKKEFGADLSLEGKALLKSDGFSEYYVPFIWKSEVDNPPNSPHYLTVDFVLDKDLREEYNELRENEDENESEWLSHHLWELIEKGFIVDVYDGIDSPIKLKEKYDDILLTYGRG